MHRTSFHTMPEGEYTDYSEESMYQSARVVPKMIVEEVSNDEMMKDILTEKSYTSLEVNGIKPKKLPQNMFDGSAPVNLRSWIHRHPSNWSSGETMDWLYYTAQEANIDTNNFRAHLFNRKSGAELCQMTVADFRACDATHGPLLYHALQRLLRVLTRDSSSVMAGQAFPPISTILTPHSSASQLPVPVQESSLPAEMRRDAHLPKMEGQEEDMGGSLLGLLHSDQPLPQMPTDPTNAQAVTLYDHVYDYDNQDMFCDLMDEGYISSSSSQYSNSQGDYPGHPLHGQHYADSCHKMMDLSTEELARQAIAANTSGYYRGCDISSASRGYTVHSVAAVENTTMKRTPGRPRKNPPAPPKDPNRPKSTRGRKPGQRTKGNHLWEFCRDLLMNPRYNRTHIQWQDRRLGVFMIMKSAEVAQMWGTQKKNKSMTYEKMSRSMRFCRKAEYLMAVPKDGRFPKKLCFRFGPLAEGWERAAHY